MVLVAAILLVAVLVAAGLVLGGGDDGGEGDDAVASAGSAGPSTSDGSAGPTSASTAVTVPGAAADGSGSGEAGPAESGEVGTAAPTPGQMVLAGDGLGVVRFGAPATEALAALTAVLGQPDSDTGLVDPSREQVLGACPAGRQRAVRWAQLTVGLLEGTSTYSTGATEHLLLYRYGDPATPEPTPPLVTAAGVTIGATAEEVSEVYGATAEVVPGDELVEPYVRVELDSQHPLVMQTMAQRVTSIRGGEPCA